MLQGNGNYLWIGIILEDRRFCVYGYFENGVCFYVGEGNHERPYRVNKSRSEKLLSRLNSCDYEIRIIADNLTKLEAINKEQELISDFTANGVKLLNVQTKRKQHKALTFEFCNKLWYISSESKTGIKWRNSDPSSVKIVSGKDAGVMTDRGYCSTRYNKIQYQVHRIVWVLYNMVDLSPDLVINHIDSDPTNNKPENLIAVTQKQNSFLRTYYDQEGRSSTEVPGVIRLFERNAWVVRWRENGREYSKQFSDSKYAGGISEALDLAMSLRKLKEQERLDKQLKLIREVKQREKEARDARYN